MAIIMVLLAYDDDGYNWFKFWVLKYKIHEFQITILRLI